MSKQILAKIGVFALIVVNLGAYYVFWPDNAPRGHGTSAEMDKGENPGKPLQFTATASAAQTSDSGQAPRLPGDFPPATVPLPEGMQKANNPTLPPVSPLALTDKDGLPPIPDPSAGSPKPFSPRSVAQDSGLSPVKADPILDQLKRAKEGKAANENPIPSPITLTGGFPKKKDGDFPPAPTGLGASKPIQAENSPWSLQMEIAAGQTTLTARLHKRTEFRIICDRVEMKTPDGAVVAVGKVSFTGPGLKGTCNRLSINLSGESLVLDGRAEVQVQQGSPVDLARPSTELKGEQLTLRLQQPADVATPVQAFPAPMPAAPAGSPSPFTTPRPFPLGK